MTFPVSIRVLIITNPPNVSISSTSTIFYPYIPIPLYIYFLPHIGHLIIDLSYCLGPGVTIYTPSIHQHPLGLVDLSYKRLGPFPDVAHTLLGCPQPLTKIPPPYQ